MAAAAAEVSALALVAARFAGRRSLFSRRATAEAALRPVLFTAIDSGEVDAHALRSMKPAPRRALVRHATALLPQLRGTDHDDLARLLEKSGAVRAARRQLRSPSSRGARPGQQLPGRHRTAHRSRRPCPAAS